MATIQFLLNNATGTVTGPPLKLDLGIMRGGGSIPIVISGIVTATVILEGTVAEDVQVENGSAMWEKINLAEWTADIADGLFTPFTHIRGRVVSYTAGNIYMKTIT